MENFVVTRRPDLLHLLLRVGVLVAVLAVGGWFVYAGLFGAGGQLESRSLQVADLADRNRILAMQVAGLHKEKALFEHQVVVLEEASDMDKKALGVLRDELRQMQESVSRFKQELEFYQGVLNNPQNANGLAVQGLYVEAMPQEGRFRYKIVLTRFGKGNKLLEGRLAVKLSGDSGGKEQKLDLQELTSERDRDFSFSLRNFTVFEGYLEIPEGFMPAQAIVRLTSNDGKRTLAERTLDWQVAT